MSKYICSLCDHLVISQAVTFDGTSLVINLPAGCYCNGEQYCIVVAQSIPAATTVSAPVVMTIGAGTQQYPLYRSNCAQASACSIRSRARYAVCVETTPTSGTFRMLGRTCCCTNNLRCLNGTAPTAIAADEDG